MSPGLIRSLLAAVLTAPIVLYGVSGTSASAAAGTDPRFPALLERFLSLDDPSPTGYRALRRLDARNQGLNKTAWMDVWTESDHGVFKYTIVAEGGSGYIRSKVFRSRAPGTEGRRDRRNGRKGVPIYEEIGNAPDDVDRTR